MGADGRVFAMLFENFAERWPDLQPEFAGLERRCFLGLDIVWTYEATDRDEWPPPSERGAEAKGWFLANADNICVWT